MYCINLLNSVIVISCWPRDAELHLRVLPTLITLIGLSNINISVSGSIRTSPFILPLVNVMKGLGPRDHVISVGNMILPLTKYAHRKHRGLVSGTAASSSPIKNSVPL